MTADSERQNLRSPVTELDATAEPDWDRMERQLLTHFVKVSEQKATFANVSKSSSIEVGQDATAAKHSMPIWRWQGIAAAGVILAAGITFYPLSSRRDVIVDRPVQSAPPAQPARETRAEAPPVAAAPQRSTRPKALPRRAPVRPQSPVSSILRDFVALPGASALPEFESGRIVRVEMPLTALPAYGIDLVPDAAPEAVQAEFLIGQDGVPRAIRLAASAQRD